MQPLHARMKYARSLACMLDCELMQKYSHNEDLFELSPIGYDTLNSPTVHEILRTYVQNKLCAYVYDCVHLMVQVCYKLPHNLP